MKRPQTRSVEMNSKSARHFRPLRRYPQLASREPVPVRSEVDGEWTRVHSPFFWGPILRRGREIRVLLHTIREIQWWMDSSTYIRRRVGHLEETPQRVEDWCR